MEILIFSIALYNAHLPTSLTLVIDTSSRLYPAVYILPHSSGIECLIKQDFISRGGYQLWFPAALMTNHLGRYIVDPSFVAVSHTLQWNRCDVKWRMTLHYSIFDVKILMHCINNDCIWWSVTFVFVLRLNPLHVSSWEVVAWLAHLWWRLSCLRQRFSYVTSDAWSRNVIRLCGIMVCVRELCPFVLLVRQNISFLCHRKLTCHPFLSCMPMPAPGFSAVFTCCRAALVVIVCSTFSLCDSDESSESDD